MKRAPSIVAIVAILAAFVLGLPLREVAAAPVHYGDNSITFAVVGKSLAQEAMGRGNVEYDGGSEPKSRWSASFRFSGLNPGIDYSVSVRGRFGEDGSDEASQYTELCTFTAEDSGAGSCFAYFRGLMRLDVVQLRLAGVEGRRVMQATRSDSGPGSIATAPNRFTDPELRKARTVSGGRDGRSVGPK